MLESILFIVIGISAGVLSGMFGIGGGIVIVPALIYLCGFDQLKAQGTSLAIMLPPVGILAFVEYYKRGQVSIKGGILICIFLIVGSFFGAKIANNIPIEFVKKGFAILMIAISIKMLMSK